jgi:hypothetical protein
MKIKSPVFAVLTFLLMTAAPAWASDVIQMRDGKTYEGDILFWNEASYVISIDGHAEHVPITDILEIRFNNGSVMQPGTPEKASNSD